MPAVTEQHREAMRARILEAFIEVLRRKGFRRLAMSDVIAESGLSAGAIYGYFRSKDELVVAAARGIIGGRVHELRESMVRPPIPPPAEALRQVLGHLPEGFARDGIVPQIWAEAANDPQLRVLAKESLGEMSAAMEEYLRLWLVAELGWEDAAAATRAVQVSPALLALAQGYLIQAAVLDDFDPDAYFAGVAWITRAISVSEEALGAASGHGGPVTGVHNPSS